MIDYNLLNYALEHYNKKGYERIEVPWMVSEWVDSLTRPKDVKGLHVVEKNKNLIASGEQGFLYLMLKGYLPKGKYQTITPCFRNDSYDFTHSKVFMKIELIDTLDMNVDHMIADSLELFEDLFKDNKDLLAISPQKDGSFDIDFSVTELGSYGIREAQSLKWAYGTGLAEPRTSRLIKVANGLSHKGDS